MKVKRLLFTITAIICTLCLALIVTQMGHQDHEDYTDRSIFMQYKGRADWRNMANRLKQKKYWRDVGDQRQAVHEVDGPFGSIPDVDDQHRSIFDINDQHGAIPGIDDQRRSIPEIDDQHRSILDIDDQHRSAADIDHHRSTSNIDHHRSDAKINDLLINRRKSVTPTLPQWRNGPSDEPKRPFLKNHENTMNIDSGRFLISQEGPLDNLKTLNNLRPLNHLNELIPLPAKIDVFDQSDQSMPKADPPQMHNRSNANRQGMPGIVITPSLPESPNKDPTIVTGLLDIGRGNWSQYRRPYSMYLEYMNRLLALDIHLVVFTDKEGADYVRKRRMDRMQKTIVQEISLNQLPLYRYYQQMKTIMDKEQNTWKPEWDPSMRHHPESTSPEYDILMNSKPYFVHYVSNWNPFNSNHFYWLDAGYGHGRAEYPSAGSRWAPENLMTPNVSDKVTFIKLGPGDLKSIKLKDMYRQGTTVVNGGFFGGSRKAVSEYYDLHNRVFEELLKKECVDDDQTLTVLCYHEKPNLFNMVVGDWYDVFRLFHRTGQ